MEPLFQSRGDIDIYLDLCEKAGILYGEGGYLDELNQALKLEEPYTLPLDEKPAVRDIFDRWAGCREVFERPKSPDYTRLGSSYRSTLTTGILSSCAVPARCTIPTERSRNARSLRPGAVSLSYVPISLSAAVAEASRLCVRSAWASSPK